MKVRLKELYSLPSYTQEPAPFGLRHGVIYNGRLKSTDNGEFIQIEGLDACFPLECFEVIEEPTQPAILNGRVETQEEIEDRLGASGEDPLGIAVKEIMQHLATIHQLAGARAQQIETNKDLLPKIDAITTLVYKYPMTCNSPIMEGIREIKKFILAGSKG